MAVFIACDPHVIHPYHEHGMCPDRTADVLLCPSLPPSLGGGGGMNRAQPHPYLLSFTLQGEKGDRGERVSDRVCLVPLPPRALERTELWGCHAGAQPSFHRVPLDWLMGRCLKGSQAPR